jgi:DNA mismatch endonuclease (patch repair protein)
MADVHSRAQRSFNMSQIRGKNTSPEKIVKTFLRAEKLRYRSHAKNLPGTPDIVLSSFKTVVFVHGCFWHRHRNCRFTTNPQTNPDFWQSKFARTVERDRQQVRQLKRLGWRIIVVWECETKRSLVRLQTKLRTIFSEQKSAGETQND